VRIVALPAAAAGFRLSGLPVVEAETPADARLIYDRIAKSETTRILLVQEELTTLLPDTGVKPLVVHIPRASWQKPEAIAEAYITALMRKAVGYHVRLR
jgi:vacuolar-type H+-ATPase subunit F/Vma7